MRIQRKNSSTMRKRIMSIVSNLSRRYEQEETNIRIKKIKLSDGFAYRIKNDQ